MVISPYLDPVIVHSVRLIIFEQQIHLVSDDQKNQNCVDRLKKGCAWSMTFKKPLDPLNLVLMALVGLRRSHRGYGRINPFFRWTIISLLLKLSFLKHLSYIFYIFLFIIYNEPFLF